MKAPYGKYAAFKARVALMRPGEELQWPDAPTANISAYLAKWGEVFGFTIRQFKGEDGHRWIRRIRDEEAAPKATVENGGIPSEDAGLRRLLRAGHSLADARRIVAEVAVSHKPASPAQVSHKPAPAPAPVAVTPAPQAPPEPATAKPCGCDAGGYCYDCTTPEQRAKLDASLIADGSAVLEKLEALADRGEAIVMGAAIEIIPAAKMPPSPLKNRAGRGELRAAIARLKPGEGVVWDDPPKPSTAYSILAKWNRKLPFNVGTFLHDGKRYIQRREETPR